MADGDAIHAVWCQGGAIQYRRSDDAGKTWTHTVPLTTSGKAQYPCSLELAGTILHLIWTDSRNPGWELYYMRSTNGGKTWGKEVRLTAGIDMFRFGTAVSGTNVHIVWGSRSRLEKVPAGLSSWTWTWGDIDYLHPRAIFYMTSADGGLTWGTPERLTQPSEEVWETGAVVGTESWALVEMMKGSSLWYLRRDLLPRSSLPE